MFNKYISAMGNYKNYITKIKNGYKQYKPTHIYNYHLRNEFFIHSGNSLILRAPKVPFTYRNVKYNVFFKKPLVRPTKRKKGK